jgi:rhodanese-related sulfurtransferase
MQVAEGVRTVGELDVVEHLRQGRPVVDARTHDFNAQATIPGAVNIPHPEVAARREELDPSLPTIFFCNGPQCGQSRSAIETLLEAGYSADKILYYRGGMHDWITLGLPTVPGTSNV